MEFKKKILLKKNIILNKPLLNSTIGPAVEYDGISQLAPARHPPLMGEHTVEILKDVLHYEESKINELLSNEVVTEGGAHKHIKAHKYVY